MLFHSFYKTENIGRMKHAGYCVKYHNRCVPHLGEGCMYMNEWYRLHTTSWGRNSVLFDLKELRRAEGQRNTFSLRLSSVQAAELIRSNWLMQSCSGKTWRGEEIQRTVQKHQTLAKGEQSQGTGNSAG